MVHGIRISINTFGGRIHVNWGLDRDTPLLVSIATLFGKIFLLLWNDYQLSINFNFLKKSMCF